MRGDRAIFRPASRTFGQIDKPQNEIETISRRASAAAASPFAPFVATEIMKKKKKKRKERYADQINLFFFWRMMPQPHGARHESQWTDSNSLKTHCPLSPSPPRPLPLLKTSLTASGWTKIGLRNCAFPWQRSVLADACPVRLPVEPSGVLCLRRGKRDRSRHTGLDLLLPGNRWSKSPQPTVVETLRVASHPHAAAVRQSSGHLQSFKRACDDLGEICQLIGSISFCWSRLLHEAERWTRGSTLRPDREAP